VSAIIAITILENSDHDLSIYTAGNIYHIKGLKVKHEDGTPDIIFETKKELKEYIDLMTNNDTKNCVIHRHKEL